MSSSHKNTFTHGALTLIFCVLLFAPVAISLEKTFVGGGTSMHEEIVVGSIVITPATLYAAGDFMAQSTTEKKDADGSKWYVELAVTIGNMLLGIGAFFAWVTGNVLDKSLDSLVFGMGDLINKGGVGLAIDSAWKIIRDLCNLAFIFGFIYLGIRTIIDFDNSSVKKTLSQIIIGALLINFSLYIVKFIIDFSNFTAYSIYNAMVSGNGSISQLMFDQLGVDTFYSTNQLNAASFQLVTGTGMLAFYLMGMLLLLIAAFVFLAAAILLITRFVALVFLMIASPVLFAATVFPQTEGTAKKLWRWLFSYAFFAPLYLLLTLISMLIMKSFVAVIAGNQQLSSTFSGSATGMDAFGVVVSFIVMIFFLINSLLIARSLGIAGGDTAISWGEGLRRRGQVMIGNSTAGLAAAGMRASVGQMAHSDANNSRLRDQASLRGFKGWSARQELKLANKLADSSFDVRNVKGTGKAMGIGEGRKGGYTTVKKEVEEKHAKFAKDKLGEVGEDDHSVALRKKEADTAQQQLDLKKNSGASREVISAAEKELAEAKYNLDVEKNRRILGSSFNADAEKARKQLDKINEEIQKGHREYTDSVKQNASATELAALKSKLKTQEDEAIATKKKLTELAATSAGQKGYAAALQESGKLNSWPAGRLVSHERAAGDSIKKAYEKKLRKTKDEVQNEAIVEAIKSGNKA